MNDRATDTIKVIIIDDHAMFREGLAAALEREADIQVVGQFASATAALADLAACDAAVVLLDVDLGAEKALDFVTRSKRLGFMGRILVVTAGASDHQAVQLIQAGVSGILHKQNSTGRLCQTIRQVARGEVCLEENYLGPLFRSVDRSRPPAGPRLTERDRAVLRFILQGLSNRDIAARLEVSEGAVKASLRQLFDKLSVRTRAQLVKIALENYRDQL
jgi:two-component system, NarL family, nitrate/nitrite response regulator NarL